jgi:hypothetical protein
MDSELAAKLADKPNDLIVFHENFAYMQVLALEVLLIPSVGDGCS